jgi:hypothetical protein
MELLGAAIRFDTDQNLDPKFLNVNLKKMYHYYYYYYYYVLLLSSLLLLVVTFIRGVSKYIPETNHVSRVHNVPAITSLQFLYM